MKKNDKFSQLIALLANIIKPAIMSFFTRVNFLVKNPYFLAFIGMLVSSTTVSIFKSKSMYGCPNDLSLNGGDLLLLPLIAHLPNGVKAGHCFPGGLASAGFVLMAFYLHLETISHILRVSCCY